MKDCFWTKSFDEWIDLHQVIQTETFSSTKEISQTKKTEAVWQRFVEREKVEMFERFEKVCRGRAKSYQCFIF